MRARAAAVAATTVAMPGARDDRGSGEPSARGRGRGGRGSRARPPDPPNVRLSKALSMVLRHGALDAGLGDCLSPDGFVPLARLLALPRFARVSEADVRAVVAACPKRRFELREDGEDGTPRVRATQGHTIRGPLEDDAMLARLDERSGIREAVHGTSRAAWARIRVEGLSRARRRHVHLARALPGSVDDVVSGARASAEVAVWVDVARGISEGIPFFTSTNGVVLTPGEGETGTLPPRLFLRAHALRTRDGGEGEALEL